MEFSLTVKRFDGTKEVISSDNKSELKSLGGKVFQSDPTVQYYNVKQYGKVVWRFQKNRSGKCIKRQFTPK